MLGSRQSAGCTLAGLFKAVFESLLFYGFNFMNREIIRLAQWLDTPPGRCLLQWESQQFDEALADTFGYHALQLGLPPLQALRSNRMPHQWLAVGGDLPAGHHVLGAATAAEAAGAGSRTALLTHSAALPFGDQCLDLLVMPHTLELSDDPHAALREAERVLVPDGRVVISGFNPVSLWGLRQRRSRWLRRWGLGQPFLPDPGEFIGYWRLRDWLRLLDFEVESARFGIYRPALNHASWLDRFAWMDRAGARWWPIFGAIYFVVAVKRVRGMRLIGPSWRDSARQRAVAVAARRQNHGNAQGPACNNALRSSSAGPASAWPAAGSGSEPGPL
jgi:SAM-dependent methyltransferase